MPKREVNVLSVSREHTWTDKRLFLHPIIEFFFSTTLGSKMHNCKSSNWRYSKGLVIILQVKGKSHCKCSEINHLEPTYCLWLLCTLDFIDILWLHYGFLIFIFLILNVQNGMFTFVSILTFVYFCVLFILVLSIVFSIIYHLWVISFNFALATSCITTIVLALILFIIWSLIVIVG